MKDLTIQEALQNIDVVVSNVTMKRAEHQALQQSITLVAQRCQLADKLEKEDGSTNEQSKLPRTDQKDSE